MLSCDYENVIVKFQIVLVASPLVRIYTLAHSCRTFEFCFVTCKIVEFLEEKFVK